MILGLRVIAVIPARGGSKSVKRNNIRSLGGKPLIAWSIETAHAVTEIDRVIVSTDDGELSDVARDLGAEVYQRPPELATDESLVIDAVRHLVGALRMEADAPQVFKTPSVDVDTESDMIVAEALLARGVFQSPQR